MTLVATLISKPSAPGIDAAMLAGARDALPASQTPVWLAPGIAVDIPFAGGATSSPAERRLLALGLRSAMGDAIDVVVQPRQGRRKRLFVADMDSTMIGQECIDELADHVGARAHVAAITERAMRGEIEFAPALRERVALLAGLPVSVLDEVMTHRIRLTSGARALVATLRRDGVHTCLVTGGFTLFARRLAEMIGFDESRANTLEVDAAGRLTGRVLEPILGREGKLTTLLELRRSLALSPDETMAVGDGANDLGMLEAAGLGVAYHAKPKVAAAAAARIDHADLTALLYVQGYRSDELAATD
jgi:phosphoserine phosphatase